MLLLSSMDEAVARELISKTIDFSTETNNVEFKSASAGIPRRIWETISSFSHRPGGGLMVFGIAEDRSTNPRRYDIVGATDPASIQERIGDICNNEMSSVIRPNYHILEMMGKIVLAIYIPECPDQFKPCYYKPAGMPNGAYIRDGNSDRKMTDDEMRRLIDNARLSRFDSTKAEDTTLAELSMPKVQELLVRMGRRTGREARPAEIDFELLRNLGIADVFEGRQVPTVAGFLIFASDLPQKKRAFSRYSVRCVRYAGSNVTTDILDSQDIQGTLDN